MTAVASCPSKDVLVTALYGEATPGERQQLERHLATCAACREEFDALGALRLALQEWDAPAPPGHRPLVVSPTPGPLDVHPSGAVVAGPARWWTSRGVARAALAASAQLAAGGDPKFYGAKLVIARFYAEQLLPRAGALLTVAKAGAASMMALDPEQF